MRKEQSADTCKETVLIDWLYAKVHTVNRSYICRSPVFLHIKIDPEPQSVRCDRGPDLPCV